MDYYRNAKMTIPHRAGGGGGGAVAPVCNSEMIKIFISEFQ